MGICSVFIKRDVLSALSLDTIIVINSSIFYFPILQLTHDTVL